jgi:hypothetical protein
VAKSKLWEPDNASSLLAFRQWAQTRASEMGHPGTGEDLPGLDVQLGQQFSELPGEPIAAALDFQWITGEIVLRVDARPVHPGTIEFGVARIQGDIRLAMAADGVVVWRGTQSPEGQITRELAADVEAVLAVTGEIISIERALKDAPPAIFLSEGSTVIGDTLMPSRRNVAAVPSDSLQSLDWSDVPITREIGANGSVQERTRNFAAADAEWVVQDHGTGEIADFISLKVTGQRVRVTLFHCKGSGGPAPGRRVGDLYEVVGQCIKNLSFLQEPSWFWSEILRRLDERVATDVVYGSEASLRTQLERLGRGGTPVEIVITAVQPGVSIQDLDDWPAGKMLLHAAREWCATVDAFFALLGSE